MLHDYYASLGEATSCSPKNASSDLVSGFVDWCVYSSAKKDKNKARSEYMKHVAKIKEEGFEQPEFIRHNFGTLPDPSWIGMTVSFTLLTPWYSKDDRAFHVLDNPVRKDRVFGTPFMSASSWKGLLRWACRMREGLFEHLDLEKNKNSMDGWFEPPWIKHFFGNERGESELFNQGTLLFYPTWFNKVDFEVINPHSREKRAGTNPIYYEVVPSGREGTLKMLYAPLPGKREAKLEEWLGYLAEAVKKLLETCGISAKRTAGWGTAKITEKGWGLYFQDTTKNDSFSFEDFLKNLNVPNVQKEAEK